MESPPAQIVRFRYSQIERRKQAGQFLNTFKFIFYGDSRFLAENTDIVVKSTLLDCSLLLPVNSVRIKDFSISTA